MRNSEYMNTLYHDLGSNSPQTVSIDIPDSMGRGRISQTTTKQGVVFSDWEMNYYTDMNVQGTNSEEYIQLYLQRAWKDRISVLSERCRFPV